MRSWQTPALARFYGRPWKNGRLLSSPAFGAIAVMEWSHVGVVVDFDSRYIWLLGGNQPVTGAAVRDGEEVNIIRYRRSSVASYALPDSYNQPPLDTFE